MQQSLLLEVRKLEKIEGVAYLEGRFKSNKYGTNFSEFVINAK